MAEAFLKHLYDAGMAKFFSIFGILALSTFILTTLDTAIRLARYIFQEFFSMESKNARYIAMALTLCLPTFFVLISLKDINGNIVLAWKLIWPVFGATNQLLAGLALMVVGVWLKKKNKPIWFVVLPMIFMLVMTLWALFVIILEYKFSLLGFIGGILLFLSVSLILEAIKIFRVKRSG